MMSAKRIVKKIRQYSLTTGEVVSASYNGTVVSGLLDKLGSGIESRLILGFLARPARGSAQSIFYVISPLQFLYAASTVVKI